MAQGRWLLVDLNSGARAGVIRTAGDDIEEAVSEALADGWNVHSTTGAMPGADGALVVQRATTGTGQDLRRQ
jgi:hypothetical protein